IVEEADQRCHDMRTTQQEQHTLIPETLLAEETLDREQIEGLFHEGKLPERQYDDSHVEEDDEDDVKAGHSYEEIKEKLPHHEDVSDGEKEVSRPEMTDDEDITDDADSK